MTSPDPEIDALIDALRSDLPSEDHERRIRVRLISAGVITGTGLTLPGAAAAASASAKAGLLSKLTALSWGAKVGLAGAVIAVALPVAHHLSKPERSIEAPPSLATGESAVGTNAAASPVRTRPETGLEHQREPSPPAEPATTGRSVPPAQPRSELLPRMPPKHEVPRARSPEPTEALPNGGSSVGTFPAIEASVARSREQRESTLHEEADIMARALSALRSGDRASALHWLDEHARRFPDGQLQRERERARERASDIRR